MRTRVAGAVAVVLVAVRVSTASPADLGERVVAYCRGHLGQRVGNGQCAGLAFQALKWAGARPRGGPDFPGHGDYVWGREVLRLEGAPGGPLLSGRITDLRPGDVMQYRNVRFIRSRAAHHTVVVESVDPGGNGVRAFAQNGGGRKYVFEVQVPLMRLSSGWIRVYRPIPAR